MKHPALLFIISLILCASAVVAQQQQPQPATQPTAEEIEKQKEEWSKNAYRLLDQVIDEAQSLRLTDNRVRIQINAADMLWERDQGRARSMFMMAGDAVAEMMRTQEQSNQRMPPNQNRRPVQLRQELVLSAARHDAQLAYQLLATTKPPIQTPTDARQTRVQIGNNEDNLEQNLLAAVAALDPKLAAQNADQMLEKGEFPSSISDVINHLRRQDQEAAAKLADKTVKRLQSANMLSNVEASTLAIRLLNAGPRGASTSTNDADSKSMAQTRGPVLDQSMYVDLLGSLIDSALKATPPAPNAQRAGAANTPRAVIARGDNIRLNTPTPPQPTEAQLEMINARRLVAGLQRLLPQIDQNLPARSQAVRQKLTEMGMATNNNVRASLPNFSAQQWTDITADALMQVAATAPAQMQSRLYQQAAYKALEEGNTDRARQIATDHLDTRMRDSVIQRIDFRELVNKAEGTRLEEVRQSLARMQSDNERIDALIRLSTDVATKNPKLQRQLLEEARQLTNKRATNYDHFEQQLKVAHAFAAVDPARTFEVLDPGISHLNELLSAAAVLNGFETTVFRDGELPLQGGSMLTVMANRFGQEIASLARTDLERSETLAGRFQFPESRIMAKLAIVQGLLGVQSRQSQQAVFRGENFSFTFRP